MMVFSLGILPCLLLSLLIGLAFGESDKGSTTNVVNLQDGHQLEVHFNVKQLKDLYTLYNEAVKKAEQRLDKKFQKWAQSNPAERHIVLHLRMDAPGPGWEGRTTNVDVPGGVTTALANLMAAQRLGLTPSGATVLSEPAYYSSGLQPKKIVIKS